MSVDYVAEEQRKFGKEFMEQQQPAEDRRGHECKFYSSLYFTFQANEILKGLCSKEKLEKQEKYENIEVKNPETKPNQVDPTLWFIRSGYTSISENQLVKTKIWIKRIFTSFVIHEEAYIQNDAYAVDYRFGLFYDLDQHLKLNHSLAGSSPISVADIMFFSFLVRTMTYNTSKDIYQRSPEIAEFSNIVRLITLISQIGVIGYDSMIQKEQELYKKIPEFTASSKLIAAVKEGNIELFKKIILKKPASIKAKNAFRYGECALHVICATKNIEML